MLLEVSRAADYAHRADGPSARQLVDQELIEHIRQAHQASKGRYGAPRIHAQLRRDGHRHARKRVARLMGAAGLHGRTPRASSARRLPTRRPRLVRIWWVGTSPWTPRRSTSAGAGTSAPSDLGRLYLATVIEIASRRIVGFALAEQLRAEPACDALINAVAARDPAPGVIFHADRGASTPAATTPPWPAISRCGCRPVGPGSAGTAMIPSAAPVGLTLL